MIIIPLISFFIFWWILSKRESKTPIITKEDIIEQDRLLKEADERFQKRVQEASLDMVLRNSGINLSEQDKTDHY
ncbi:hypothetical protein QO206_13340 [Leeuwenhoekiella aequorea]|uniref:hypothetical protein n=1 Tax=Leeuwenhoekiella aequorea TaxID=283736 RepID=UPI00352E6F8E